jgi:hypothetical protein
MPIVEKTPFLPDQVPTAAQLNEVYNDLAVATAAIDEDNGGSNWLTYAHLTDPALNEPINKLYFAAYNGPTAVNYNSTVFQSMVSNTGTITEVNLDYFPNETEVLRLHMSGLVGVPTVNVDYDFVGTNLGKPNYYAFRIMVTYSDSGGPDQNFIAGYWGYSFTTNGLNRYDTTSAPTGPSINWQTFQASTIVKYKGTTGVRQYKKAILQVAVFDNSNTLSVVRQSLQAVRARK